MKIEHLINNSTVDEENYDQEQVGNDQVGTIDEEIDDE